MHDLAMTVEWRPIWYSPYQIGGIVTLTNRTGAGIDKIYRRGKTIKVYTVEHDWPLNGRTVEINGESVLLRGRGRFGHLHHGTLAWGVHERSGSEPSPRSGRIPAASMAANTRRV